MENDNWSDFVKHFFDKWNQTETGNSYKSNGVLIFVLSFNFFKNVLFGVLRVVTVTYLLNS